MKERDEARGARQLARAIRGRLSYANVMSTIAVFAVFAGGGAYAASKIGPKDIAKNAVRAKHVKKNQVRTKHIKAGAVTEAKLADGVAGLQGPAGPQGEQGDQGPSGPSGPSAFTGRITGIPATPPENQTIRWGAPSGVSPAAASSSSVETLSPNAAVVARDLVVEKTGAAVPPDNQIVVNLFVNGGLAFSCAIQNNTGCASGGTAVVAAGSTLAIQVVAQGPADALDAFDLLLGWRATT